MKEGVEMVSDRAKVSSAEYINPPYGNNKESYELVKFKSYFPSSPDLSEADNDKLHSLCTNTGKYLPLMSTLI